jgi:hypothetical protein
VVYKEVKKRSSKKGHDGKPNRVKYTKDLRGCSSSKDRKDRGIDALDCCRV